MIKSRRRIFAVLSPLVLGAVVALAAVGGVHSSNNSTVVRADQTPRKQIKRDKSAPLRSITPKRAHKGQRTRAEHRFPPRIVKKTNDPAVQTEAPTAAAPTAGTSFDGIATADLSTNYVPPDPNAAVGPNAIVEVVNTSFQVFSKTGASIYGPADTNTIWSGFGGDCEERNDGDATVSYDRAANRWVMQQFSVAGYDQLDGQYFNCIAVSATGDPTGAWYRYQFGGFGDEFPDYPKLGVWSDGYYVTYNLFENGQFWSGPMICAYERVEMLDGNDALQQCKTVDDTTVNGVLPSDLDGATQPPAGSPNYLLGLRQDYPDLGDNSIVLYTMAVNWDTPANTALVDQGALAGVDAFNLGCDAGGDCSLIPQKNSGLKLDTLGDRLMFRLAYRNFGSYEALAVTHSVAVGSRTGVRWYELRKESGDPLPVLHAQGTWAPDDGRSRWMGSSALDASGNMALGYSISSSTMFPGLAYTGKLKDDTEITQGETTFQNGGGSQTTYERWGDYSSMSIDPSDDCTFWYTGEYLPATGVFNWNTRIASFKLPGCVSPVIDQFSLGLSPSSDTIEQGGSDTSEVSTAITNGAAQTVALSATGMPHDTTVSFSPTSVTSDGGSSTMTVDVGDETPVGTYELTVSGTGATDLQTKKYTLTVGVHNAVVNGDFETGNLDPWQQTLGTVTLVSKPTIKKSKIVAPVTPNYSAQIGTTGQGPAADSSLRQTVDVPAGQSSLALWYQPRCKSSRNGDYLRIELRNQADEPIQTLLQSCKNSSTWVKAAFDTTGQAGNTVQIVFTAHYTGTRNTTYFLVDDVVLSRQLPGLANGNFETGDLTGWLSNGTNEYVPTPRSNVRHGGTWSVRLGSSHNPGEPDDSGESGISQAVVIPGVNPALTIWYQPHCRDLGYDYIQVQVRKNPGGQLLRTLLSACKDTSKWQKATFDLSPWRGQSVTLVLNVSNDTSIATASYFDDVSLSSG